jgi:hypothetical protein
MLNAGPLTRVPFLPNPLKSVQIVPLPGYEVGFPASRYTASPLCTIGGRGEGGGGGDIRLVIVHKTPVMIFFLKLYILRI